MKKLFSILLFFSSFFASATKHVFSAATNPTGEVIISGRVGNTFYYPVPAGDTIELKNDQRWQYLSMSEYNGTAANPIVIISDMGGGQVILNGGFSFFSCHHLKLTGTGDPTLYCGFKCWPLGDPGAGQAMSVQGNSSNIWVWNVEVYKSTYGIAVKMDPACPIDDTLTFPFGRIDNIHVEHCRFINIGQDVGYLGNTDPTGQGRNYHCGGVDAFATPTRCSNITINHCYVDSANRSGFQMSGTDSGYNEMAFDTIKHCGYEYNFQQGSGMYIGGMSANVHLHDNIITGTFNPNISATGIGLNYIYNNRCDSAGYLVVNPYYDMDSLLVAIDSCNFAAGRGHGTLTYSGHVLINSYAQPSNINIDTRDPTNWDFVSTNNQGPALDSSKYWIHDNLCGLNASLAGTNIYVYQSYRTYFFTGSVICSNTLLDGVTGVHLSGRGFADGQDPNPPSTYIFNYSTDCRDLVLPDFIFRGKVIPPHSIIKRYYQ